MYEAWISFFGAILGGFLTLLGVALTIRYYKNQEERNTKSAQKVGAMVFYNFLLVKVNLLEKIHKAKEDEQIKLVVQGGSVYTELENLFLYERIHCIESILTDAELGELLAFMGQLQQFEAARCTCETDLDKNNQIIHKTAYDQQLDNCFNRLTASPGRETIGIWSILGKIEAYLE